MKSTRLNAAIRKAILNCAVKKTIWVKMKAALEERSALAEEVRQLSFGGKIEQVEENIEQVRKAIDELNNLTGDRYRTYLNSGDVYGYHVTANIDGMHIELPFADNPTLRSIDLSARGILFSTDNKYLLTEASSYREWLVVGDPELKKRIMANVERISDLEKEAQTIIPTIAALLRKAQTVAKLIELWPEAKNYIPEDLSAIAEPVSGLPISIDDLNSKLAMLAA